MKKIFSFLPNLILSLRERENIIRSMSVIFFFSITLFGRVNAQCGFTAIPNGCIVLCTPTGMPPNSLGSFILNTSPCDNSPANPVNQPSGPVKPGSVTSFNVNPQSFPCNYQVTFTVDVPGVGATTCTGNVTINSLAAVTITNNSVNKTSTITYTVCLTQGTTNSSNIVLNIVPQSGLVYQSGSFQKGQATTPANSLTSGGCTTVSATYAYPANVSPCLSLNVAMTATSFCTSILGNFQNVAISNPNVIGIPGGQTLVSSLPSTAFDNNPIIEGELIFNAPNNTVIPNSFLLFGKNLWMKANSSITVNAPIAFGVMLGSNIRGCEMWDGITLKDGSSMQLGDGISNSKIEDAWKAVDLDNAMLTTQAGAQFNHNQWAVRAGTNAGLYFSNTVFDGGALKDGTTALRGLILNQTNVAQDIIQNTFTNYQDGEGIYATNFGYLNLLGNHFLNSYTGIFAYISPQKGIIQNGQLSVRGLGKSIQSPKTFENCQYGINTTRVASRIDENNMENVDHGLYIKQPRGTSFYNNRVVSNIQGIVGFGPTVKGDDIYFENNTVIANNHSAILFFGNNSKGKLRVKENNITLNGFLGAGIHADLVRAFLCQDTIAINGSERLIGINLDGTTGIYARNIISGTDPNLELIGGIEATMTDDMDGIMTCNSVSSTYAGITFRGSSPILFETNKMENHTYGLYLDEEGVIGEQPQGGGVQNANEWKKGTFAKFDALHGDINSGLYKKSRFYIDESKKIDYKPTLLHPNQGDWFEPKDGLIPAVCPVDCNIPFFAPTIGVENKFVKDVLDGTLYPPTPRGGTQQWTAERQLYNSLRNANYTEGQNALLDAFLNSNSSSKIFFDIAEEIADLETVPSQVQSEINKIAADLGIKYKQLATHDSIFHYNTIYKRPIATNFWTIRNGLNENVNTNRATLASINEHLIDAKIEKAAMVKEKNSAVICSAIYEANQRDVNNVYLDMLINLKDSINTAQEDVLTHIALQCPEDGGSAVFMARSILAPQTNYYYNFDELCATKPIGTIVQSSYTFNTLTIAPNPIKDEFKVFIANEDNNHYDKIAVFDIFGRIVYAADIEPDNKIKILKISSATFATGNYQCVLFEKNVALARQKLYQSAFGFTLLLILVLSIISELFYL